MKNDLEESDPAIVATNLANNTGVSGARGAKGRNQGECGPAKHVPGTGPGKCVPCAGPHTECCKAKEEGEVHRSLPSHQSRDAEDGVLRTQA